MVYIRADMNSIIATGHVMRCLSIADAAKSLGEETTFILADNNAKELIEKHGHKTIILNTQWYDMDSELPVIKELAGKYQIDRILVDSYQVTENYLYSLSSIMQTFFIDDLNAFFYPVENIICYANYWEKFKHSERYQKSGLFLGTKYVPLRREFCECGEKIINSQTKILLILSGGTDKYHILGQILEQVDLKLYSQVNVICGRFDSQYKSMKSQKEIYSNINFYHNVSDIERFMKEADLAISAGGLTLYELCAVGTPTISYSLADNQLENVRKFHEDGIIDYAGDVRRDDVAGNIGRYLHMYYSNPKLCLKKSKKMQKLVDGKGAWRIAKILTDSVGKC